MKCTPILWMAALLCLCQQIEARTPRFVLADEEAVQGQIESNVAATAAVVQPEKTEKTEKTDKIENTNKTDLEDPNSKHDCPENENEEEEEQNIIIIDADELQRILELADEAQGRATRRYNLRLRRGPSRGNRRRGNRRRGNRRRAGLRRVPRPTRTRNGQPVRRATIRRRQG